MRGGRPTYDRGMHILSFAQAEFVTYTGRLLPQEGWDSTILSNIIFFYKGDNISSKYVF